MLDEVESSIRNKFVNIQRDTAKKILNRFCKPPETKNKEVQTDEDFIKAKLESKKLRVKIQKGEIKDLNTKLAHLEEEHKLKTYELTKIKRNMDDLEYRFSDIKAKYETAASSEFMYKKKYSEVEDRVKILEEDIEDLEVKRRMAEKIVKTKEDDLKKQIQRIEELEK